MTSALAPLLRGSTYRRGVFLLLGGVIVLPYVLLAVAFAQMFALQEVPHALVLLLLVVTVMIAATPAFLRGTRALEIVAARGLLCVDLPDPAPDGATGRTIGRRNFYDARENPQAIASLRNLTIGLLPQAGYRNIARGLRRVGRGPLARSACSVSDRQIFTSRYGLALIWSRDSLGTP